MNKAIFVLGAVALISLAAPASALTGLCYGEAMRCRQAQHWRQTGQPAYQAPRTIPRSKARRAKHRRDRKAR